MGDTPHKIGKKKTSSNSKCDFCPKTFYERNLFYGHARKHHMDIIGDSWVKCEVCSNLYPDSDTIARHKRTAHNGSRSKDANSDNVAKVKCDFCDQVFRQTRSYYGHANAYHHEIILDKWCQCPDCKTYFPTPKTLRCHKQASSCNDRDAAQGFQCEYCPAILSKHYIFFQHANKKHFEKISGSWLPCLKCGLHLPNEHHLTKHTSNKHPARDGPRNALCSFCPAILGSTNNFIKHANAKHKDTISQEWILCPDCPVYLPSFEYMANHRPLAHRDLIPMSERIGCMFCQKLYSSDQGLNRHVNQHHYDEIYKSWFKCDICEEFFQTNQNLVNHKSAAHKRAKEFENKRGRKCQFCEKSFSESSKYFKHANASHPDEVLREWVQCPECSKCFPNQVSLNQHKLSHKEKQHRKEKTKCEFCPEIFDKRNQYSQHVNKDHYSIISKEWHGCDSCKLFFQTVDLLMVHLEQSRHVSQLPKVQCQFCQELLETQDEFYSHANEAHFGIVSKEWIKCSKCSALFPRIKVLKVHKKICVGQSQRDSSPVPPTSSKRNTRSVDCDYCRATLKNQTVFHEHANEEHLDQIQDDWKQCSKCSKYFPNAISLSNHKQRCNATALSNRTFKCQYCDETLSNQLTFFAHAYEHHAAVISDDWKKCDDCFQFFPTSRELRAHQKICAEVNGVKEEQLSDEENLDEMDDDMFHDADGTKEDEEHENTLKIELFTENDQLGLAETSEYEPESKRLKVEVEKSSFECSDCDRQFFAESSFRLHLKDVHLKCNDCNQQFEDIDNHECKQLSEFIKLENDEAEFLDNGDGEVKIKSERSDYSDDESKPLKSRSKKPVKPRIKKLDKSTSVNRPPNKTETSESQTFSDTQSENQEIFIKDETSNKYKCIHCYLTFREEIQVRSHIQEAHKDICLDCEECNKTFANGIKLKQHYATVHIAHKNYECKTCGQRFRARSQLSRHALQADHVCSFECGRCCEAFHTYALYLEHLTSDRHSNLECKFCQKTFTDSKHLKEHMKRIHLDGKNFVCQVCSKKFFTKAQLGKHCLANNHASIFECAKCIDAFASYELYKEHLSAEHPISAAVRTPSSAKNDSKYGYLIDKDGNRYIECPECCKRFTNVTNQKKHIKVVHLNIRDFICEICSKAFAESRDLRSHIQLVHLKQRNFQCESCGRKFGENKKLRRHIQAKHPDLL